MKGSFVIKRKTSLRQSAVTGRRVSALNHRALPSAAQIVTQEFDSKEFRSKFCRQDSFSFRLNGWDLMASFQMRMAKKIWSAKNLN